VPGWPKYKPNVIPTAWKEELGAVRRDAGVVLQQLAVQALQGISTAPGTATPPVGAEPADATAEASDFPDRQALRACYRRAISRHWTWPKRMGKRHGLTQQPSYQQLWALIERLDFPAALAHLDQHFGEQVETHPGRTLFAAWQPPARAVV
jgi:hypothetical protein